ncbi:helix-turn-helix transcriptional regulator [Stenotrophomonas sp.]|uniref:helix-turn-helix transcriptional regulator n=1 Tax=Stenotrophomonas sp. TaxID=69392 RepID=UPI0028A986C2|nr:helix-turn-helix transcriptional regulator [Stenotrophomonas sp.]
MIDRALRLTREFHRMKQGDLAKKLGISTSYLSEIENGKKSASLELLEQYSKVFNVPASTFLLFKERLHGEQSKKNRDHAQRLLDFFAWVTSDDEDAGEVEEGPATAVGKAKKAIRTT